MKTSETEPVANLPKKILGDKLVNVVLCMKKNLFQVSTDYTSSMLLKRYRLQ